MMLVVIGIYDGESEIVVDLEPAEISGGRVVVEIYPPEGMTSRQYARRMAHKLLEAAGDDQ